MLKKIENIQSEIILYTLDQLVPKESLFRKIDKYIDFTFIYEKVEDLYCLNNGRNSVDPVVLFKLVFIQALDGLKSMRKTCEKVKVDLEYRWFLGIPLGQETPHYSTFSQNYIRRFKGTEIFEEIFVNIVEQAIEKGLVKGAVLFSPATAIPLIGSDIRIMLIAKTKANVFLFILLFIMFPPYSDLGQPTASKTESPLWTTWVACALTPITALLY